MQGVLEPGAGTEIMLSLYVEGGHAGSADFLTSTQVPGPVSYFEIAASPIVAL